MHSTRRCQPISQLLLILVALVIALACASRARANACPGADPCPWTGVHTIGDVGNGEFRAPYGMAADPSGNIYVVENDMHRVQKLDSSGAFLAKWGEEGTGDGKFSYPYDVAVDAAGRVYVTDTDNDRVEKFDTSGNFISAWGWGVADGSAAYQICTSNCRRGKAGAGAGQLASPRGIATDGSYVYVADDTNKRIQKFDLSGGVVGQWTVGGQLPEDVAVSGGKVYVSTGDSVVWRFDTSGTPDTSWSGDGVAGSFGSGADQFKFPEGVAVDGTGVYVADSGNHRIQKLDANGNFVASWGTGGSGAGQFHYPYWVLASAGSVWVADTYNHRLQKFSQAGVHQATAGSFTAGDFYYPGDVAVGPSGDVYVAEYGGQEIQVLDGAGNPQARWDTGGRSVWSVTPTSAGVFATEGGPSGPSVRLHDLSGNVLLEFGSYGSGSGQLKFPYGSAVDAAGNLYVAELFNHRVQKFDSAGNSVAMFGTLGSGDGQLNSPRDVAVDADGNVYVADSANNRVQKFGPAGNFLAKWGGVGVGDGQFDNPGGITLDAAGNVFVSDTYNHRIQQFDRNGNFLAKWGAHGTGPGELLDPRGLSVDASGAVWVADEGNHRVVRFCCPGAPTTSSDGAPSSGYGAPTGTGATSAAADTTPAHIKLTASQQRARRVARSGLALRIAIDEPAAVRLRAGVSRRIARRLGLRKAIVAQATTSFATAGSRSIRLRLTAAARHALLRIGTRRLRVIVRAAATDRAGNRSTASLAVAIRR